MIARYITIKADFVGYHKWVDAPEDVAFLRNLHRHVFYVKVTFPVNHNDRYLEFFQEKRKLKKVLTGIANFMKGEDGMSCEWMAERILKKMKAVRVVVSEDGENEAEVVDTGAVC